MICNICGSNNIKLKRDNVNNKYYYKCLDCGATRGCRESTPEPYGIFADKEMRRLRRQCHDLMDKFGNEKPRWKTQTHRRSLYRRLANAMQLEEDSVHFAKMSKLQLEQAKMIMEAWEN